MEITHIKNLISTLNKLKLKYAFTGAFAVSYYGEPRTSSDIDILIEKNKNKLLTLTKLLTTQGYDITRTDVQKAIEECSHFPIFHKENTFPYFDFKIACQTDETTSIQNSTAINYHGAKCKIVTPEDLIIKKLEWNDIKDVQIILNRHKNQHQKTRKHGKTKSSLQKTAKTATAKTINMKPLQQVTPSNIETYHKPKLKSNAERRNERKIKQGNLNFCGSYHDCPQ